MTIEWVVTGLIWGAMGTASVFATVLTDRFELFGVNVFAIIACMFYAGFAGVAIAMTLGI